VSSYKSLGTFELIGPGGAPQSLGQFLHKATLRIPLTSFGGSLTAIRGVRFAFGGTAGTDTGEIRVAYIRASKPH